MFYNTSEAELEEISSWLLDCRSVSWTHSLHISCHCITPAQKCNKHIARRRDHITPAAALAARPTTDRVQDCLSCASVVVWSDTDVSGCWHPTGCRSWSPKSSFCHWQDMLMRKFPPFLRRSTLNSLMLLLLWQLLYWLFVDFAFEDFGNIELLRRSFDRTCNVISATVGGSCRTIQVEPLLEITTRIHSSYYWHYLQLSFL